MTRSLSRLAIPLFAAVFAVGFIGFALAQAPAPEPAAASDAAAAVSNVTLWQMWVTGGWAMYPIGALSIAAVALTILGFLATSEPRMIHLEMAPSLKDSIRNGDIGAAISACTGTPCPMTNIFHAGLRRITDMYQKEAVEKAFGLLGTVSGMIKAFQKIGLGGMGDPEKLAADIGEAMITTAFGLIVGIPAMFFYFTLKTKFLSNMARIGRVLGDLTHDMDQSLPGGIRHPAPAAPESPPAAPQA